MLLLFESGLFGGAAGFLVGGADGFEGFPLLHIFDVQAPPGEAGGQAGVLPIASDSQGHLGFRHHYVGGSFLRIQFHAADIGGAQGAGDEGAGVGVPFDDINLFALEFVDDALDAVAAQSDAGAYGVHAVLAGENGDFAADAGVAGDGADFDGAVADFGDFGFHQAAEEVAVGAADDYLGAAWGLRHFHQQDFDVLALAVAFVADLVFGAHYAAGALVLGLVGVEVDIDDAAAPFHAVHAAADDFPLVGGVFVKNLFPLGFAQALDENLAGGLGGDAAVVVRHLVEGDFGADFGIGGDEAGIVEDNLGFVVLDFVHHRDEGVDADFAGVGIQLDGEVFGAGHAVAAEGGGQGDFHFAQHQILAEAALGG